MAFARAGIGTHANRDGRHLRLLERYADRHPFEAFVSHEFGLADADLAMHTSMSPESLKVVINPSLS